MGPAAVEGRSSLESVEPVERAKAVLQKKIDWLLDWIKKEPQSASVAAFDADTLATLQAAHDEACQWLAGEDGIGPTVEVRTALASRILEAAKAGERDGQALKIYALKDLETVILEADDPQALSSRPMLVEQQPPNQRKAASGCARGATIHP